MVNNYGVRVAPLAAIGTNRFGLHVSKPATGATTSIAAYLEDCSIGSVTEAPSNGLYVSGNARFNARVGIGVAADSIIPLKVAGSAEFGNGSISNCTGIQFSSVVATGVSQTYLSTYIEEQLSITWNTGVSSTQSTSVVFRRFGRTVTASITGPSLEINGVWGGAGYPVTATGSLPSRYAPTTFPQYVPIIVDDGQGNPDSRRMGRIYIRTDAVWQLFPNLANTGSFPAGGGAFAIPFTTTITYNI
jgi:hypothetical protein